MLVKRGYSFYKQTLPIMGVMQIFVFVVAFAGFVPGSNASPDKKCPRSDVRPFYVSQHCLLVHDKSGLHYDWHYEVLLYQVERNDIGLTIIDEVLHKSMVDVLAMIGTEFLACERAIDNPSPHLLIPDLEFVGDITDAHLTITSGRLQIHVECWVVRRKGRHEANSFHDNHCHEHVLAAKEEHDTHQVCLPPPVHEGL